MRGRYNPWEEAQRMGVRVVFRDLPGSMWGCWHGPSRTVILDRALVQRERRTVLAHELVHAERGDSCRQTGRVESEVHAIAARRLIPLELLADALRWTRDVHVLADELWVDVATMECRLATLTDDEREQLEFAVSAAA